MRANVFASLSGVIVRVHGLVTDGAARRSHRQTRMRRGAPEDTRALPLQPPVRQAPPRAAVHTLAPPLGEALTPPTTSGGAARATPLSLHTQHATLLFPPTTSGGAARATARRRRRRRRPGRGVGTAVGKDGRAAWSQSRIPARRCCRIRRWTAPCIGWTRS